MKHICCILISGLIFISSYKQPNYDETSHYLFPEFTQGVILMKDGKRNGALMNYNSLTEEMIFDNKGKKLAFGRHEMPRVDTVFIKDRKFVALKSNFFELVYHSKWDLYVEHLCRVEEPGASTGYGGTSQTSAASSKSTLLTNDGAIDGFIYDLGLPDGYKTKPYSIYWLKKNGDLNKFVNMRELKNLYKDKKDLFKEYSKINHVKYQDQESITAHG